MNVILLEPIANLGGLGEEVNVKPGFARNYLLRAGKAVRATENNRLRFEERRAELERRRTFLKWLQDPDRVVYDDLLSKALRGYRDARQAVHDERGRIAQLIFGEPRKNYEQSRTRLISAVGGFLYTTGESDRPPMGTALEQTHVAAARNAAIAVMGAILQREATGEGQHIDVSIMEAVVSTPPAFIHQYSYTGAIAGRGFGEGNVMDGMHLSTADSDVTLTTAGTGGNPMQTWADFLDEPRLLDRRFATPRGRAEHAAELLEIVQSKLRNRKAHEFMTDAMDRRLVVGVVQSPEEVAQCPHLAERGTFVGIDHPHAGVLRYPGPGFLIDGLNPMTGGRPAPRLGEHNAVVFGGELGLTEEQISRLA